MQYKKRKILARLVFSVFTFFPEFDAIPAVLRVKPMKANYQKILIDYSHAIEAESYVSCS